MAKMSRLFHVMFLICCCSVIAACTMVIKSSQPPLLQVGSPLKAVQPKTFLVKEFKDVRGVEPHHFTRTKVGTRDKKTDVPVTTIVRTAIIKELERNGHKCFADGAQQDADYIIEGTVYKYWFSRSGGTTFGHYDYEATVAVKLSVVGTGSRQGSLTKNYEGSYPYPITIKGIRALPEVLNQALLNMLKELTTDQQFVDAIQK